MKNIENYDLPIAYGSALINDDWSGLDPVEEKELREWLEKEKPGDCVDVSEDTFITRFEGMLTECASYTFFQYE